MTNEEYQSVQNTIAAVRAGLDTAPLDRVVVLNETLRGIIDTINAMEAGDYPSDLARRRVWDEQIDAARAALETELNYITTEEAAEAATRYCYDCQHLRQQHIRQPASWLHKAEDEYTSCLADLCPCTQYGVQMTGVDIARASSLIPVKPGSFADYPEVDDDKREWYRAAALFDGGAR